MSNSIARGCERGWMSSAVWRSCSWLRLVVLALLAALILTGCAGVGSHGDLAAPSPVVLRDPVPGQLDVFMAVQYAPQGPDVQPVLAVHLSLTSGGRLVQFAGGDERVTCEGATLTQDGNIASFKVVPTPPVQASGATVRCEYAAGGTVAGVSLRIPPMPAITSPQPGAQVQRSAQTPVTFSYDSATTSVLGIVALSPPSPASSSTKPHKAIAQLNMPAPLHATLDTSGFPAGPGSVVLTASLKPQLVQTGVPFKTASAGGSAVVPVLVTWA